MIEIDGDGDTESAESFCAISVYSDVEGMDVVVEKSLFANKAGKQS